MDLLDLFVKIGVQDEASDKVESIGSKLKTGLATAGKVGASAIGLVTTAASAAVGGLLALESASEEYRVAQGKLNTAFQAAGYSAETANQAYTAFYGILGDTDTATEASQLLAKLAESEEDVAKWTNIAAGVSGTFGDSLPIEGLIEASNETAKTGTVVGVLADALNWAGISEDEFNEKLASASSESERNQLIMETLSATYDEASDAFYRNNEALVASRNAQAQMDATMATLGQTVSNVKTRLIGEFLPAISQVVTGLSGMLSGTAGAEQQFSQGIGNLITSAVAMLPQFLDFGVQILSSVASGIVDNLPVLIAAVPQVITSLVTAVQDLWPTIVDAGGQILVQVGNGIVEAIPDMLEKLPDVIVSLLEFFTDNFPQIVATGAEMLGQLLGGIIGSIPEIVSKLPQVITAIVNALKAGLDSLKEAGGYLIEGLWSGISDKVQWLKDKIKGFADGVVSSVKEFFGIHSPSTVFYSIGEYMMSGLALGLEDSAGEVMETIGDIVGEIGTRFSALTNIFTTRQDISGLEFELWEKTIGKTATDTEKYAAQLEYLTKQQQDQEGIVEAAVSAYQAIVEQYGDNTQESYNYQKTLLEEQIKLQDLQDEIYETIAAMQELSTTQGQISNVSFENSGLGVASAANINAMYSTSNDTNVNLTANLVTPDGQNLATWQLPYLIKAGNAAGTPIAETQRA